MQETARRRRHDQPNATMRQSPAFGSVVFSLTRAISKLPSMGSRHPRSCPRPVFRAHRDASGVRSLFSQGYDGGDCCECTCVAPEKTEKTTDDDHRWGDDDQGCGFGFACVDPSAPCVDDDDVTAEMVENCNDVNGLGEASPSNSFP